MRAMRWTGEGDHYFGPFTYARERGSRQFGVMLCSGDGDDYPGCSLRLHLFGHTLIAALPPVIKPLQVWHEITTEPTRSQMLARGKAPGYFDSYRREYGFTLFEGSLHTHFGEQTHASDTDKSKCYFLPWREQRMVRHSLYDLRGDHFATLPEWGARNPHGWTVRNAIEGICPTVSFAFDDFDGERIVATTKIEEREWQRGTGLFKWLGWVTRNKVRRSLDIRFDKETGNRKGSWKGGTIGCGIDMHPGELHEGAFRRYCEGHRMTFIGETGVEAVARAIETADHKRVPDGLANGYPDDVSDWGI